MDLYCVLNTFGTMCPQHEKYFKQYPHVYVMSQFQSTPTYVLTVLIKTSSRDSPPDTNQTIHRRLPKKPIKRSSTAGLWRCPPSTCMQRRTLN